MPGRRSNNIARRRCRSREDRKESLKAWVLKSTNSGQEMQTQKSYATKLPCYVYA